MAIRRLIICEGTSFEVNILKKKAYVTQEAFLGYANLQCTYTGSLEIFTSQVIRQTQYVVA